MHTSRIMLDLLLPKNKNKKQKVKVFVDFFVCATRLFYRYICHQNGTSLHVCSVYSAGKKQSIRSKVMCVVTAMPYIRIEQYWHSVTLCVRFCSDLLPICIFVCVQCACARFTSSRAFYSRFLLLVYLLLLLLSHLCTIFSPNFSQPLFASSASIRFVSLFLLSFACFGSLGRIIFM